MNIHLPSVNAGLNASAAAFLLAGFYFIKKQNKKAHACCMIAACAVSVLFLISYLYYHYHHGVTRFPIGGPVRDFYLILLGTHTILAAVILPLIVITLVKAARGNFNSHKKIARFTWPIWLYVSVTGVVVYWMLYRIPWKA